VWAEGGRLSLAQLLRCRIRYFTAGMAVGRETFLKLVFEVLGEHFSKSRKPAGAKMRGGEWGELRAARALRVNPVDPGG
jgi:putative transposase